jgi:hypothetical protein
MMKTKHYLLPAALSVSLFTHSQVVDLSVHFPKGSAVIEKKCHEELITWTQSHQSQQKELILLRGHTDSDAGDDYNMKLSARRNKSVERELRKYGFNNIRHTSHGENWPICEYAEENCMYENRRVELVLLDEESEKFSQNMLEDTPDSWFVHDLSSHQFITKNGSVIYLPESPFVGIDDIPVSDYRLEVYEFLTPASCIFNKMTTTSDGKILQTGGMMYIMAYAGREQLHLGKDKSFDILFPSQASNPDSRMQSFEGRVEQGNLNWIPSAFSKIELKTDETEHRFSKKFLQKDGTYMQTFLINSNLIDVTYSKSDPPMAHYECPSGVDCQLSNEQRNMLLSALDGNKPPKGALTFLNLGWANCDRLFQYNTFLDIEVECKLNSKPVTIQSNNVLIFLPDVGVLLSSKVIDSKHQFDRIPANQKAVLVAIEGTEDNYRFDMFKTVTDGKAVSLELELLDKNEISNRLSELVWGNKLL